VGVRLELVQELGVVLLSVVVVGICAGALIHLLINYNLTMDVAQKQRQRLKKVIDSTTLTNCFQFNDNGRVFY
jgi:hypothetical protein